ncbi:tyrosine-protein phosphatase [Pseudonocardia sp.]|uniref:tyrosine-protein phosphatase n=1 Tax=Pseudonocardia sp. TaxID=60912 RepID=UPI0026155707|nr:tyrosine-protein phosphatase [Pseudonocardia sp.]
MTDPARHVSPLAGAFNFRDLGGLRAGPLRRVREGALFRSDTLQALTADDVARLVDRVGVELLVDLRLGPETVAQGRGPLAAEGICYLNAPLPTVPVTDLPPAEQTLHFSRAALASPSPVLPTVVRLIAAAAGRPTVLHCAAGKDRTGLVTALTLRLAGVDEADVVADYLASAHNMPRIVERFRDWPFYRDHMATVPPEVYQAQERTIRGLLDVLDRDWGGAAGWAAARGIPASVVAELTDGLLEPVDP